MRSVLLACLFAVAASGAELEAKIDRPYELVVCLRFSDDARFTRLFARSVRRQVQDQLANYFQTLAEVKVITQSALFQTPDIGRLKPLLGEAKAGGVVDLLGRIEAAGLGELTVSPAEFAEAALPAKVFLVEVDFADGRYRVRWRQLDAEVQQLGPLYARSTPDRQWLAKAICVAVKEDFAPVAQFRPDPHDRQKVTLRFRGANLAPKLTNGTSLLEKAWLAGGCVLKPFWVIRQADGSLVREPIPHTVLRIDEHGGGQRATVVSSLPDPLRQTARVVGFQAIRLTTRSGRFRLKLVSAETGEPILPGQAQVYAGSAGFDEITPADRLTDHDRYGYVVAGKPFEHVAYIKISSGEAKTIKLALPITNDWCEQVCRISIDEQAAETGAWRRRLAAVVQDLQVLQTMMDQYVREVNELSSEKRYEPAHSTIRSALKSLPAKIKAARDDLKNLEARAGPLEMSDNPLLAWAGRQIDEVTRRQQEFAQLAKNLERIIDDNNAVRRATGLINLARQAENAGDIDEAIIKYELALQEWPNVPQVQRHLDELKQSWKIKSPQHEKTREFIDEQWAGARLEDLEGLLPEARNAFGVLRQVDDYLTARKLMKATDRHLAVLNDVLKMLMERPGDEDRRELEAYSELSKAVAQLQVEVGEYLAGRDTKPQPAPPPERDGS